PTQRADRPFGAAVGFADLAFSADQNGSARGYQELSVPAAFPSTAEPRRPGRIMHSSSGRDHPQVAALTDLATSAARRLVDCGPTDGAVICSGVDAFLTNSSPHRSQSVIDTPVAGARRAADRRGRHGVGRTGCDGG